MSLVFFAFLTTIDTTNRNHPFFAPYAFMMLFCTYMMLLLLHCTSYSLILSRDDLENNTSTYQLIHFDL